MPGYPLLCVSSLLIIVTAQRGMSVCVLVHVGMCAGYVDVYHRSVRFIAGAHSSFRAKLDVGVSRSWWFFRCALVVGLLLAVFRTPLCFACS